MIVEILFPEFANLYGDTANIRYLKQCAPDITFIETHNNTEPFFVKNHIDMLYIGSMPESTQLVSIEKLSPYLPKIKELIENDTLIFCTGNSIELFGEYIEADGKKFPALGIFPFHAERVDNVRHNFLFLGEFEDMKIVGHKSQFSLLYGDFDHSFIKVNKGMGQNLEDKSEGIHYKNFFATYVLGPFLVLNPYFTKYLLRKLGHDDTLKFEKEIFEAYNRRLKELEQDNAYINIGYHGC